MPGYLRLWRFVQEPSHDIWGADWIPVSQQVKFEALINIRPQLNNFSMTILDRDIRERVERVVRDLLEGL